MTNYYKLEMLCNRFEQINTKPINHLLQENDIVSAPSKYTM